MVCHNVINILAAPLICIFQLLLTIYLITGKGIQTDESMLPVGTALVGLGRITADKDKVILEPPTEKGSRYILTMMSKRELIKSLKANSRTAKVGLL